MPLSHFDSSCCLFYGLAESTLLSCRTMVVGARLLHLRQLALEGAQMHIVQSFSLQSGKFKVKFLVGSVGAVVPPHFRQMHVECIDSILALMQDYIVMDRGHKHSVGQSQICLWFANREAQPVACDDDPDSGNGDVDGAGASDGVPDETAGPEVHSHADVGGMGGDMRQQPDYMALEATDQQRTHERQLSDAIVVDGSVDAISDVHAVAASAAAAAGAAEGGRVMRPSVFNVHDDVVDHGGRDQCQFIRLSSGQMVLLGMGAPSFIPVPPFGLLNLVLLEAKTQQYVADQHGIGQIAPLPGSSDPSFFWFAPPRSEDTYVLRFRTKGLADAFQISLTEAATINRAMQDDISCPKDVY